MHLCYLPLASRTYHLHRVPFCGCMWPCGAPSALQVRLQFAGQHVAMGSLGDCTDLSPRLCVHKQHPRHPKHVALSADAGQLAMAARRHAARLCTGLRVNRLRAFATRRDTFLGQCVPCAGWSSTHMPTSTRVPHMPYISCPVMLAAIGACQRVLACRGS